MSKFGISFGRDTRPPPVLVTPSLMFTAILTGVAVEVLDKNLPGVSYDTTGFLAVSIGAAVYGLLWLQCWQQKRRLNALGIDTKTPDPWAYRPRLRDGGLGPSDRSGPSGA